MWADQMTIGGFVLGDSMTWTSWRQPGGVWVHGPVPLQEPGEVVHQDEEHDPEVPGQLWERGKGVWRLVQS